MPDRSPRFSLVNLGCPKNTVDSEGILGSLALDGFRFTPDPMTADICVVNTCGFLAAAREEAAEVLAELAQARGRRGRPRLVATGCAVEREGGEPVLKGFLEDADARVGFADYPRLPDICRGLLGLLGARAVRDSSRASTGYAGRDLPAGYFDFLDRPRMRIGSECSAYLKIGEGCSNCCAYCSIPLIRGRRASRPMKAILKEARELVASGAKELNLIAQDTTAYGMDIAGKPQLAALLKELLKMPEDLWFRILYAHPKHLTEEILAVMGSDGRVCPYLDLPLQHVNERMLKAMGRGYGRRRVEEILERTRGGRRRMAIRTSFIVGHPGEGEAEFEELLAFVGHGAFDHMGVFTWSPEPGTVSAKMEGRVDPAVAEERRGRLMQAQADVLERRARRFRGRNATVLIESRTRAGWGGRTVWQAPDVDGATWVQDPQHKARMGTFLAVRIISKTGYDWQAEPSRP